jgi:hypothetical protein
VNKKTSMLESNLADIEQAQSELRSSIEKSKVLAEQSQQMITRHRRQLEDAAPTPARPLT